VYSTSRPFEAVVDTRQGTAASVVMQIPRAMVPLSSNRVAQLMAARMSGREGVGRLLAGFLTHLTIDTAPYRPADGQRLGSVLIDLVTAWLAHLIDAEGQTPAETRQHMQVLPAAARGPTAASVRERLLVRRRDMSGPFRRNDR